MARQAGIPPWALTAMCERHELVRLFKSVYLVAGTPDSPDLRISAVRLVAPPEAVVCDTTAAWVRGIDVEPPGGHLSVRPASVFKEAGHDRMRIPGVRSGERHFDEGDIVEIAGLRVTTAVRTAWDLGRLQPRYRAMGGLDAMLRLGEFSKDELLAGIERFRGQRGVVQLRDLAPRVDPRAESLPESMLRLHWEEQPGLGRPVPQLPVFDDGGIERYRLDLADPIRRVAAEYDGVAFHAHRAREDGVRREWITETRDIHIEVFTDVDLFGRDADPARRLRQMYADHAR
ncbi:hypothetical protein EKO23_04685 [Nocardioides guangzhouensis]|uniref:AbiEi antitoxin C-terminal domain-containing protein n=1 Tax=Nocardioides guangzhouensis TaxID=2497878 RepID=A0A4Q4ZIH6_9ACTN|nr:hypothetical protein [Nocardioides guangzhouensis]RYP87698.1 hypothetical protein EKO23_04685 [Nocardioides guangzhouensis]